MLYKITNKNSKSPVQLKYALGSCVFYSKFVNIKCHVMYFVLLIIALVPWVQNDREQSLSLYCALGQESVGCTCS